jgi:hypothetical protein
VITGGKSVFNDKDLQERARVYRKAMEERQREDDKNRARWARWDAIEKAAREKAVQESELAHAAMMEVRGVSAGEARPAKPAGPARVAAQPKQLTAKTPSSALKTRIDAARKKETDAARATARKRSEEEAL